MKSAKDFLIKASSVFEKVPLLGGLVECEWGDHWDSFRQVVLNLLISTMPIWLATLVLFGRSQGSTAEFYAALRSTVCHGELFMYCTALLAPIFWLALVDPPGARPFPSKLSHVTLMVVIDIVAALYFGLGIAGYQLNQSVIFPLSIWMFVLSVFLLYLGTVYHSSRLPDAAKEFRNQESDFSEEYREHREKHD